MLRHYAPITYKRATRVGWSDDGYAIGYWRHYMLPATLPLMAITLLAYDSLRYMLPSLMPLRRYTDEARLRCYCCWLPAVARRYLRTPAANGAPPDIRWPLSVDAAAWHTERHDAATALTRRY